MTTPRDVDPSGRFLGSVIDSPRARKEVISVGVATCLRAKVKLTHLHRRDTYPLES